VAIPARPGAEVESMHSTHREMEILDELKVSGSCRIQDLARRLDVSEETIRRNVKKLAGRGLVRKVHGGVYLPDAVQEAPFAQRMDENPDAKRLIAGQLAQKIQNGDSLILDLGSTTAYVARALRGHHDLFVVTNSLAVAQMLATRNNNRVFMAGGELRAHDAGAFGREAINFVRQFTVGYAVLSAAAIDAESGFMLFDLQEAEFSREIIQHADRTIMVADATKFGRHAPVRVENPGVVDTLVTDAAPPSDIADFLGEAGVRVVVAQKHA
jgi:DeoR family glycerol-3-phosphate regulon repressor